MKIHQAIAEEVEIELRPCACGGAFRRNASPRCPKCKQPLSAEKATPWIEANAPGTAKGWRWQRDWVGIYAFRTEKLSVKDTWKSVPNQSTDPTLASGTPAAGQPARHP